MADLRSRADGAKVIRRYDDGKRQRQRFDQRVDMLAPYIEPTRGNVLTQAEPGAALMARTYDSEGIYAADMAAKFIGGELHGPGSIWFSLLEERDELNEVEEVKEWFEECRDRMLKDAAASNFYAEAYEHDIDWSGFGIGSMMIEQRPLLPYVENFGYRGTRFTVDKIGRYVCFENGWGEVDQRYTELELNAHGAVQRFGEQNLPESVVRAYRGNELSRMFRFVHGIFPREEKEKSFGSRRMPFASVYVHYDTKEVVGEGGYEEYPAVNARWTRVPGEAYGRGLGEIALNNMLTLNTAKKMSFEDWALKIKPMFLRAHDAMIGAMRLKPWGVLTVRLNNANQSIGDRFTTLQTGSQPEISQINEEELRRSIRLIFYIDQLRELMMVEGRTQMTATEFLQKISLLNKILGPVYGRWESEFGYPLIGRHFNLMYRNGAFSDPPDVLLERGGTVRVKFESPLARAQRIEEIQAMTTAMGDILPIAEAQYKYQGHADVLDNYDFDEYAQKVGDTRGVPASLTRSRDQVAVIRQSRAEAQQQQRQAEMAMMMAEGAGKVAPFVKAVKDGQQKRAA